MASDSCDFCHESPVVKSYRCENFSLYGVPVFSSGSGRWRTCQKCAELVTAGEWSSLAEKMYQKFANKYGVAQGEEARVREQFSELITQFAIHLK
jgi:hypothetical protein